MLGGVALAAGLCPSQAAGELPIIDVHDGSHTSKPGFKPKVWVQDKDQTAFLCGCKHSAKFPFCDGTHKGL